MIIADLLLSYFNSFYQVFGSSPVGLVTMGAGHPGMCGQYHPDASGSLCFLALSCAIIEGG